ncbi:MAG: quinolinate synthase NadA [Eubacterium sp.]|nr:quinolinate synthase NadA [Eubacterium sp.]
MDKVQKITELKKEKDVVIMAHYYVDGKVQALADHVGDSFALSKLATTVTNKNILFCGVKFMGESAKILNPQKTVIMPDITADCPMAHMVEVEKIKQVREMFPDVAVVCYVNSTAEIKSYSDVCVTSSNAVKVVKALPNKDIFFIPDNNLAQYVAKQVPEKHFIFNDGFCPIHKEITKQHILDAKEKHPGAPVLTHPECTQEVLEVSDFIGSTSEIIDFATRSDEKEFLIATETGVFYELQQKNPEKVFYSVKGDQICPDMKKITLENVLAALESFEPEVIMEEDTIEKANAPLVQMLELAK